MQCNTILLLLLSSASFLLRINSIYLLSVNSVDGVIILQPTTASYLNEHVIYVFFTPLNEVRLNNFVPFTQVFKTN